MNNCLVTCNIMELFYHHVDYDDRSVLGRQHFPQRQDPCNYILKDFNNLHLSSINK